MNFLYGKTAHFERVIIRKSTTKFTHNAFCDLRAIKYTNDLKVENLSSHWPEIEFIFFKL